jgi:hypothetical protein
VPSIEARTEDDHDGKHKESPTEESVASDTEGEADDYEPPDALSDCLDDEVAQKTSHSMLNHQVEPADYTMPSSTLSPEQPQKRVTWDVLSTECKPYEKSAPEWVRRRVDDQAAVATNADAQKHKRRRTEG